MIDLNGAATAVWNFLNTNFSAALFGAFAGAAAAQMAATRSERKKRLVAEISGVNNSIQLASTITNTFLTFKHQHISKLAESYGRQFQEYVDALNRPAGQPQQQLVFNVAMNFYSYTMPLTPIVELRDTILDRVTNSIKAITMSVHLHQCVDGLASSIADRSAAIKILQAMPVEMCINSYFGLHNGRGFDERYPDSVNAICSQTDDIIYFSMLLCDVLQYHAVVLTLQLGSSAPPLAKIDYSGVDPQLLPDSSNYPKFEKAFRPPQNFHITM